MTEQTPAAPGAAAPIPVPVDPPVADQPQDETAIWDSFEAADEAAKGDKTEPAPAAEPASEQEPVDGDKTVPEAEPTPATPAEVAVDIWANATPEQKAAFETASADKAKAEQRYRSSVGRISALQRKINAAQPSREASAARDEIAGMHTDYPEIAQPLAKALEKIDGKLDNLSKSEQSALEADTAEFNSLVEAEKATLLAKHPDYADVLGKNAGPHGVFAKWLDDQPRRIRDAAARNATYIADGDGAIEVIEAFKTHLGLIKPAQPSPQPAPQPALDDRRKRQIEGSSAPLGRGGRPTVSGIPPEGDPQAIWDAFEQQERARA